MPQIQSQLRSEYPLTDAQLMQVAPSIFATKPFNAMSERYAFIPSSTIVQKLRNEGFQPFHVAQSRTRVPGKGDYTRHMIRFRDMRQDTNAELVKRFGGLFPELIFVNSHDGSSTYRMDAGIFRSVCANGLIVCETVCGNVRERHSGSVDNIIDATYEVVEQFPKMVESIESFNQVKLAWGEQQAFAKAALDLKYEEGKAPVTVSQVLAATRQEDLAPTLWNTFNRVQEHLTQGGLRGRTATGRRTRTRAVTGITEDMKLNKALWTLAEELKKLKQ